MSRKKVEVVELNKKEEKIILEEQQSALALFWLRNRFIIFLTLFILSLTILIIGILLSIKNLSQNEEELIKEASIDTNLDKYKAKIGLQDTTITESSAKNYFNNNGPFSGKGEVLLVETIDNNKYIIRFFSDGTAIRISKTDNKITRIKGPTKGGYGINKNGIISSDATISEVSITNTKKFPWGTVTYYSDGSAEVSNSEMDMFVRDAQDINDNFISDNKVSYIKETKKIGNIQLNYYYDGTIEIIEDNKNYVVRTDKDIEIKNNKVIFKNHNEATIITTKKMKNGTTIDYYSDGGAIINDGERKLSVRKSNSIVIKNNDIYEIVDSIYVTISKKTNDATYYTNGSAVIEHDGKTYYIAENSDIKYDDKNNVTTIGDRKEELTQESKLDNENTKVFEKTAVITTDDYIAIVPSDGVLFDDNGKVITKTEDTKEDIKTFTIANNTNENVRYRVVLERSNKTNLSVQYIRYIVSTKNSVSNPKPLVDVVWKEDDISKELNVKGINYILLDSELEAHDVETISVMLWTDYDTIPNSMQNKYFYGTIRLYAWTEK